MAKGMWLCLVVVLAVASTSSALKCYFCVDCEKGSVVSRDCPPGTDKCAKTVMEGKVQKSCAPKAVCNLGDLAKKAMGDAAASGVPASSLGEQPEIECCETDYCNAASIKLMNPVLLLVLPLALYLLRC